jgi:hypothetical protein
LNSRLTEKGIGGSFGTRTLSAGGGFGSKVPSAGGGLGAQVSSAGGGFGSKVPSAGGGFGSQNPSLGGSIEASQPLQASKKFPPKTVPGNNIVGRRIQMYIYIFFFLKKN